MILYADEVEEVTLTEEVPEYPVHLFFTKEGYFKKITPQSLRMSGEQKLKEGDQVAQQVEDQNSAELLFFSDRCQVYKGKAADFGDTKASVLGEYIPARLQMEENEKALYMAVTHEYEGYMLFFFENGKVAKVEMSAYQTKQNRKKLVNAYSDKSPLAGALYVKEDCQVLMTASSGRMLLFHTGVIQPKTTKNTQGVQAMNLKKGQRVIRAQVYQEGMLKNPARYTKSLPALGAMPDAAETAGEQMHM